MKVRKYKHDENGELVINKAGEIEFEYLEFPTTSTALSPKYFEDKVNTFQAFLNENGLKPTHLSFAAHIGLHQRDMTELINGTVLDHPIMVDDAANAKRLFLKALIENDILEDKGQMRAVFRYKSFFKEIEAADERKLEIEERVSDKQLALQEDKFEFQKKLLEDKETRDGIIFKLENEI